MAGVAPTPGRFGRTKRGALIAARLAPLRSRAGAVLVAAAVLMIAAAAAVLIGLDDEPRRAGVPLDASVKQLHTAAADAGHPIYWAGTISGTHLELTETKAGNVFVRYLPDGARVADARPAFLTVATYPVARAYAVTDTSSRKPTMVRAPAPRGGLAVWSKNRPTSVYLAYPGSDQLVEVFSPDERTARRLVLTGEVGRVAQ